MEAINPETRTSVYFGITYVLAMDWIPEKSKTINFQKALLDNGLDFSQTNTLGNVFTLIRSQPSRLQIKLESPTRQVSSIHIIAQNPSSDLEMFIQETDAVTKAYQQAWPSDQYQILRSVAKIQHLYSSREHAFKYLWEGRLGQSPQDFECLGKRPVAGGGLRLIMPPYSSGDEEPHSTEIRIESFLQEPRKILIETASAWPKPRTLQKEEKFNSGSLLEPLEKYAINEVWTFLTQRKSI